MMHRAGLAVAVAALGSCQKAPLQLIQADFVTADTAWFEEEDTLFAFWEVQAEQGLGPNSVVEIRYVTDTGVVDWTPIHDFTALHEHRPVECGSGGLCGSYSFVVPNEPRSVSLRVRYHRDGTSDLEANTVFNVVGPGAAHTHRSLLVYGVFDEDNQHIQWRARHNFPTLRNEEVRAFGLRRELRVQNVQSGSADLATRDNPYGYGTLCPNDFQPVALSAVETVLPAVSHPDPLPAHSSSASTVCADATVFDGLGEYTRNVIALKNPVVRQAFPVLNSPVQDATPVPILFGPCDSDPVSLAHEAMQRQRLQMQDVPTTCIDDPEDPALFEQLVAVVWDQVQAVREAGDDMVLVVAINHDDSQTVRLVEDVLSAIVPRERHRSSPRVAGAFVLDSTRNGLQEPRLERNTLWCPTYIDESEDEARCPPQPDIPDTPFQQIQLDELPIFPDRDQYLEFLEQFDVDDGGSVSSLRFRVPRFSATTRHYDAGEYGVMTFLNQESISASAHDAFSFCAQEDPSPLVFSSSRMRDPTTAEQLAEACEDDTISQAICDAANTGSTDAAGLVSWHAHFQEADYHLGLRWAFPFLLRLQYETVTSTGVSLLGYSVPFGNASPNTEFLGTGSWLQNAFPLAGELTQCRRFCDHPTFDSAGVYQPTAAFRSTYSTTCYAPTFPTAADLGFPRDP